MDRGSTPRVEPVTDSPAAVIKYDGRRALVVGDYHAGIEVGLRYERSVELPSNAADRRERLQALLETTTVDRLIVLGDLGHRIGSTNEAEREELDALYTALVEESGIQITVALGNHDGGIDELWGDRDGVDVLPATGGLLGDTDETPGSIGLLHGHTWPDPSLLSADVICIAHEHPTVKLQDSVGGYRTEKAWLRGRIDRSVISAGVDGDPSVSAWGNPELIVFPAFNNRSGGTWINTNEEFLAPFLPDALVDADCYLLDGTRLGEYTSV